MIRAPAVKPKTFQEFIGIIDDHQKIANHPLWYRGTGKLSYQLIPSLYRHPNINSPLEVTQMEQALLTQFEQRSIPYVTKSFSDEWALTFFMQHYRVPTRLLDWTENPLVALYFAVMSAIINDKKKRFDKAVVVWLLDPIKWNRHALRHVRFERDILTPNDPELSSYIPGGTPAPMPQNPLAIYGAYNSPRIVAQKGAFTVFGNKLEDMERTFKNDGFPNSSLLRIVLNPSTIQILKSSILSYGITESTVFPDLDGLAAELRRINKFEG